MITVLTEQNKPITAIQIPDITPASNTFAVYIIYIYNK